MNGAREYAQLFKTEQFGRLYLVSSHHARGRTFRIFVLPEGEKAIPNGLSNPPLNPDAVEVYGVTSGNPGWTECYGWRHRGPWEADFALLVESRKMEAEHARVMSEAVEQSAYDAQRQRVKDLLATYPAAAPGED